MSISNISLNLIKIAQEDEDIIKKCLLDFDDSDCELKNNQELYPITITSDMYLVHGHKQYIAYYKANRKVIPAIIVDTSYDGDDLFAYFAFPCIQDVDDSYFIYFDYGWQGLYKNYYTRCFRNWNFVKFWLILSNDIDLDNNEGIIYKNELRNSKPLMNLSTYNDYSSYFKSNFHGGCNDKILTTHEELFKKMFPYLRSQVTFGTGKGGMKLYGCTRYIADFVDDKNKFIIEIDGKNHHSSKIQGIKDEIRNLFFKSIGYHVIRFSNKQVEKLFKLYIKILCVNIK